MSIDMSQFYQVFFEEAQEHLASMESLLLGLDVNDPDSEQLNAVFRAAHSIKGSAGTFGFTDLADVTHILENLLDRIRKGELALRVEMIDAFLDAGDILKALLAAHRGEGEADLAQVGAICKRLSQLTATDAVVNAAAEPAAGSDIVFILEMDAEAAGQAVDNLVTDLSQRWSVIVVRRADADDAYWRLRVGLDGDADVVRTMLEFIARSDSIRILPAGGSLHDADDSDGAYGFFDTPEPPSARPDSPSARPAPAQEEAYGFFEPLPAPAAAEEEASPDAAAAAAAAVSPAPTSAASRQPGSEGEGFGFFVDLPLPPPEAATSSSEANSSAAEATKAPSSAKALKDVKPAKAAKASTVGETSIRVDVDKVDQLINQIGELVITQAMLAQSASVLDPVQFERLHNGLAQLERNTRDLQESVMSIRMMPISVVFSRFPRVVRDLSQKLGKQVELQTIGEGTELDKSLIERISDPLTHLVRNSLDHGIEMPDERAAKGKPPLGTITLKAYHQSGNIVIEVGDDGAGLNRQKILEKAKERGMAVHDQMTDNEVWMLIFEAGFSTADQITEVSGRGVGMDVVKRNIGEMGGRVEIESMPGIGTRMTVRLPLTLAILDGMSIAAGKETYIIPLGYVIESLQAEPGMIKSVSGVERLIQVRGEYLPVVALHEIFKIPDTITRLDQGIMVIVEADGVKAALFIDALVGQHQVVIKSLESNYRKVAGVAGATIMGDGHVALILDVVALVHMARNAMKSKGIF